MKHPVTSQWYVSTTSPSYDATTLLVRLYIVFKLRCHDLISLNSQIIVPIIFQCLNQTPDIFSTKPKRNKKSSLDFEIAELVLHVKTAKSTIISVISFVWIYYTFISKTTYCLAIEFCVPFVPNNEQLRQHL